MAVRVALLILVTGLFAALWSGDHPDQMANVEHSKKANPQERPSNGVRPSYEVPPSTTDARPIHFPPLPAEISPGTYLVADQFGKTEVRVIASSQKSDQQIGAKHPARNHYTVETKTARWHYIRITSVQSYSLERGELLAKIPSAAGKPVSIEE